MNAMKCIAIFFCLLSIVIPADADDTYLLRNKFEEGRVCYFQALLGQDGVTRAQGAERETVNNIYVLFEFKTDTVTESEKANVTMNVLEMYMQNPLVSSGTKPDLKKMLGLGNSALRMTLDSLGTVIHAPKLGGDASGAGSGQGQLTEQIPWLYCPEGEVKIGDTWNQSREVPLTGASKPVIAHTTYTLTDVEVKDGKRIAVIQTLSEINEKDVKVNPFENQPVQANLVFSFTFKNYDLHNEGTIYFDLDAGHIISKDEEGTSVQEMESDISIDQAAFPANIVNSFKLTTKAEYFENRPEQEGESSSTPESKDE